MLFFGIQFSKYSSFHCVSQSDKKGVVVQIKDHMPQYFIAWQNTFVAMRNNEKKTVSDVFLGYFI